SRRGLRDDRRVQTDDRTGDAGADPELRRRRDAADHRPDKWALPLSIDPRMEMVRDLDVRKPGRLGALRGAHHLERTVLLARYPKPNLHRSVLWQRACRKNARHVRSGERYDHLRCELGTLDE